MMATCGPARNLKHIATCNCNVKTCQDTCVSFVRDFAADTWRVCSNSPFSPHLCYYYCYHHHHHHHHHHDHHHNNYYYNYYYYYHHHHHHHHHHHYCSSSSYYHGSRL